MVFDYSAVADDGRELTRGNPVQSPQLLGQGGISIALETCPGRGAPRHQWTALDRRCSLPIQYSQAPPRPALSILR